MKKQGSPPTSWKWTSANWVSN
ncbi:UNVERIFIED_CONTAM: hypothetical protein GTU68_033239 [Idotea baltica]|nr:hypothetical protein [Idotea baltica]